MEVNQNKAVKYLLFLLKLGLLVLLVGMKVRPDLWEHEFWVFLKNIFSLPNKDEEAAKFLKFPNIILSYFILILGLHLMTVVATSIYRRRNNIPKDRPNNVVLGIQNLYILLTTTVTTITVLSFFGIDIKSLFTGLTIVAASIAIITKDYIANIISGIAISFSDEISIGDFVKIGEHKGKVIDISISRITLLTDFDDIIFIPNDKVYISDIINFTKKGIRRVSIDFEIDLATLDTVEELEADLIDSIQEYHESIEDGSFKLRIADIQKDHLKLKFQYTLKSINRELEREIRRKTVRRVVNHIGRK